MLALVHYNGSKLKEFTLIFDKTVEGRKVRKLPHDLNIRFKIDQVTPLRFDRSMQSYLLLEN